MSFPAHLPQRSLSLQISTKSLFGLHLQPLSSPSVQKLAGRQKSCCAFKYSVLNGSNSMSIVTVRMPVPGSYVRTHPGGHILSSSLVRILKLAVSGSTRASQTFCSAQSAGRPAPTQSWEGGGVCGVAENERT